ncbi:MAG: hypothetical protein JXB23_01260 [Candidatus Aminicenantes bacterium]|nr:hypothetical protein [Candidatus Aminicenantes bacterium]
MKFWINFGKGFHMTRKKAGMVLLLFVLNLIFALILAVPMYHSLKDSFGNSLVGQRMTEGFDTLWWEEFRDQSQGLEQTFTPYIIGKGAILNNLEMLVQMKFFTLPPLLLIFGLAYIILHTFLAGGILATFNEDKPEFTLASFFERAGRYFLRFFLLMLVSWLFFFGLIGNLNQWFGSITGRVAENAFSEITPFYLGLLFSAVILFLILFTQMIFDYARITVVTDRERNILKAAHNAFRFVIKNPGTTLSLFYTIFAVHIVVTLIYIFIKNFIPESNAAGILIAFIVQQLFVFAVVGIRCWLYASQLELYKYVPADV